MRLVIAAGFAAAFTGCSAEVQTTGEKPHVSVPQTRQATTEAVAPGAEIVTLRSRNGRVTVYASEVGPLFTITTNDGTVEAKQLSYVELQDRYPDHYRRLRDSIAADGLMYAGYYDPEFDVGARYIELGPIKPIAFEPAVEPAVQIHLLDASSNNRHSPVR